MSNCHALDKIRIDCFQHVLLNTLRKVKVMESHLPHRRVRVNLQTISITINYT